MTNISTPIFKEKSYELVDQHRRNVDFFFWGPSDMPCINTSVVRHYLIVQPFVRLLSQIKWKVGEEKRVAIDEEVNKLANKGFITKVKYITWLANIVMVKKALNKWQMYIISLTSIPMNPYPYQIRFLDRWVLWPLHLKCHGNLLGVQPD